MIRWTRRSATSRPVLAALAVVGGVALAGCGAGQQAQTAEQRPTVDGANVTVGSLAIRDVALEYPEEGLYEEGGTARLRMVIVNEGTSSDQLIEVRTDAADDVTIRAAGEEVAAPTPTLTAPPPSLTPSSSETGLPNESEGPADPSDTVEPSATTTAAPSPSATQPQVARISIPSNGLVSFRDDGPTVQLVGLTEQLRPTQNLTITLVFQDAGPVTTVIPVAVPDEEIDLAPTVEGHSEEE